MFDILPTLGSEAAAYVARHHSEVMRRLPENSTGQNVPHAMRILNVRVKRISVLFGVIVANCPARLHVLTVDARYDVSPSHDMKRGPSAPGFRSRTRATHCRDIHPKRRARTAPLRGRSP